MTAIDNAANPAMRQLALNVLAQHAGTGADAGALAAAAQRAYDDLARVSAPLIGEVGVDALTGRAVHLAQRQYSWLVEARAIEPAAGRFAQFVGCLQRQEPAVAIEAAAALFAQLAGLLVTFIGEPLTLLLLRKAWPGAFADANTGRD
jgi:hypothetical protein